MTKETGPPDLDAIEAQLDSISSRFNTPDGTPELAGKLRSVITEGAYVDWIRRPPPSDDPELARRWDVHRRLWPALMIQSHPGIHPRRSALRARFTGFGPWIGDRAVTAADVERILSGHPDGKPPGSRTRRSPIPSSPRSSS